MDSCGGVTEKGPVSMDSCGGVTDWARQHGQLWRCDRLGQAAWIVVEVCEV